MTDFEKIMIEIGDFGAYQVYSIILLQFCFLAISPSYQMGSVFYAIEVLFWKLSFEPTLNVFDHVAKSVHM